jgi:hypothetical protein
LGRLQGRLRSVLVPGLLALGLALSSGLATPVCADDAAAQANRQFIQAVQLIRKASATYDPAEEAKLLQEADRLLDDIITRYADTDLAVQLLTNQFVGDFDFYEFRNRVRSLVCNDQQSSKCFLFRIGNLLPPVETPITAARWDWLSLAVAYDMFGDSARAKEIIAPFLSAARRGAATENGDHELFVARALSLTNQMPLALELTRATSECSSRLYNLADIARAARWRHDQDQAVAVAQEAQAFAKSAGCTGELGLVARTLFEVGREAEARAAFASLQTQAPRSKDDKSDCCSPETVIAAAEMAEPATAMALLRTVQEENPWTIAAVLGKLAQRGETASVIAAADQVQDADNRGEAYAELIEAFLGRHDRATAEELMKKLVALAADNGYQRPALLAQRARAEKALYGDERWRATFQQAVTAADHASSFVRRDIGGPLVAILVKIETGQPLLD